MERREESDEAEMRVLVTGFGPFRAQFPVNPSWEIARGLPERLPAGPRCPPVRILLHPEPVPVSYQAVLGLVPALWQRLPGAADVVIHMGMAGPRPVYLLERCARRRGYSQPDVDGQTPGPSPPAAWQHCPDEIETELHLQEVLGRWQALSGEDMDLRISDDAGRYLCDYIYYASLSHLWRQRRPRKVLFLHVPAGASDRQIAQGRALTVGLIRAVAESEAAASKPAAD